MRFRLATIAVAAALTLALGAAWADACGGGPSPLNLRAPATLNGALRAVFLKAHPQLSSEQVAGPIPGRTYYGSYGDLHAVATFQVAGHHAYPSVFWKLGKTPWRFVKDTHGGVGIWQVSPDLLTLWGFTQWRHTDFYVEPR